MSAAICLNPYTDRENATLAAAYARGGIAAAAAALPHRSLSSIYHRAARLGVKRRRRWTAKDDELLRNLWGWETLAIIARELGRSRITVYWRAQRLGLELGCPDGWEYLSAAAERCGYKSTQLDRILCWAGVRIRPAYSRRGAGRTHIVDPIDVDDAVARWMATETIEAAARRHGMSGEALSKWLSDAGVAVKAVAPERHRKRTGKRLHRRVESAAVDRVVAERRTKRETTESVTDAARRIGVTRQTLVGWLREAGQDRPAYHWRVAPSVVDVVASERRGRKTCRAWRRA